MHGTYSDLLSSLSSMKVLYKLYDAFSGFRLQIALHFFNLYSARMLLHFFYFAHLAVELCDNQAVPFVYSMEFMGSILSFSRT